MSDEPHNTDFNFEKSMQEIDTIVASIEKGELSLDESLKQYERGNKLIRLCQKFLEQKNKQLEEISAQTKETPD